MLLFQGIDYGYNERSFADLGLGPTVNRNEPDWSANYYDFVNEAEVSQPSEMIELGDSMARKDEFVIEWVHSLSRASSRRISEGPRGFELETAARWAERRHRKRINLLFVDNHVESKPLSELFQSRDPAVLRLWNRDNRAHLEMAD